jgi:hypothetical protein
MFRLLNGSILANPVMNKPNEGGDGGGNPAGNESGNDGGDDATQQNQAQNQGGEQDQGDAALAAIADVLGKKTNPDIPKTTPEDMEKSRKTLQADMVASISAFSVPKDLIPENFDPTNPQAMAEVFNNFGRQIIMEALPILMKPMQLALSTMDSDVNRRIKESLNGFEQKSGIEKELQDVPGYDDPAIGPLLKNAVGVLRESGQNDKQIVSAIKAMAARFNVPEKKKGDGRSEGELLDFLFPGA